ncbi:MAG: YciI family protein [Tahibacter sp.]
MRVMVLVKATEESEKGFVRTPETMAAMAEMERFNDDLRAAGVLRAADGLMTSAHAKRVAFDGASRTVIDGPFPHPRELVAGFWLWDVENMDEAVAWVKRCPNPMAGPSVIEIRPIEEMADLADAPPAASSRGGG